MSIVFTEEDHKYRSTDPGENIEWLSVTTALKLFKEPFDPAQAKKQSEKVDGKYYGLTPEQITQIWADNSRRSTELGTWYHKKKENELLSGSVVNRHGIDLLVMPSIKTAGGVLSRDQKLKDNSIYPEHLCYLKSAGLCGQADEIEIVNGVLHVRDHKSSKKIDRSSVLLWNDAVKAKTPKMMKGVLSHLECCEYNHYSIQLSLYAYMVLRHNFNYTIGSLTINHILFEENGEDKYGNRIIRYNEAGEPIVKDVVEISLSYMKQEAAAVINYLKEQNSLKKAA
jgi:hypothetical protein